MLDEGRIAPQHDAERGVADGAGDNDAVTRLCRGAPHHGAVRDCAERRDRHRQRSRGVIGIAAEQRTGVMLDVVAKSRGKSGDPCVLDLGRQGDRHQKTDRLCTFGGEIGQIHPQRLAADIFGRIVGKKMHARDDAVRCQHQIAVQRRRDDGRVVFEA